MDDNYYSSETLNKFKNEKIFLGKKEIENAYASGNRTKFRTILKKYATKKDVQDIVYVIVTNSVRKIIRTRVIPELTKFLRPYGELIISGGEAFNTYVNKEHRIVTSDIDTKFIPLFEKKDYFRNLQIIKIIFWEKLNNIISKYNRIIYKTISKSLDSLKISKMLGMSLPKSGPALFRRYTLMMKSRTSRNINTVSAGNTLIDVELFAIDLGIKYFNVETDKVDLMNLGGILDIAFMRPNEFGSEIITDFTSDKYGCNLAGKGFFLHDLYAMQKLGLRPNKKQKDHDRMKAFARHVAGIEKVNQPFDNLFKIAKQKIKFRNKKIRKVKFSYSAELKKVNAIDPLKNKDKIVKPTTKKLYTMAYGIKGPKGLDIKEYNPTNSNLRVNVNKHKWVKNTRHNYIRDEYDYRLNQNANVKVNLENMPTPLYGYKTRRNYNIPRNVVNKSAQIQYAKGVK
jgi:hypothetical protein